MAEYSQREALIVEIGARLDNELSDIQGPGVDILKDLLVNALVDMRQCDDELNRTGLRTRRGGVYEIASFRRSRERDAVTILRELGLSPKARASIIGPTVAKGLAGQLAADRRVAREEFLSRNYGPKAPIEP